MFKTMWPLTKTNHSPPSGSKTKESLSEDLHQEVRSAAPGARLSYMLRNNLERLDKAQRRELVTLMSRPDGCAPLFIACKKGNLEIVEYLIETCGADVEQKGTYEVVDDKTSHRVSPLWCAAVSGRINIVKCLVKHGANVNSVSDTGSTPVRSACFMTHQDIVQFLVEQAGADIQLPNYNGGTSLINSVQSSSLCEYLLSHGANVNSQDIQFKTALHYAIQEHRFETTRLLLKHGADPFVTNRYGDDALQTAALKGATSIFNYLLENLHVYTNIVYPPEKQAEMYELMGSTFLDEHHDLQMALSYWKKATELREEHNVPKPAMKYNPLYSHSADSTTGAPTYIREFQSRDELENISSDLELLRINSLLIAERILGSCHKDVIFRIMYRGAAYADSSHYTLCIKLWRYALQLRIEKDSLLYGDTCFTALALIRLYLDLDRNRDTEVQLPGSGEFPLKFEDLMGTFLLLIDQLPTASALVRIRPIFKRQQESYDRCLRCCTHLLYLILKLRNKTQSQWNQITAATKRLVSYGVRMCSSGDTLLHMCVSRNNIVRSHFFVDEHQVCVFPSYEVEKFLVDCGADVNAVNDNRATPLHLVVNSETYDSSIVDHLLNEGAHVDQLDKNNRSPLQMLLAKPYLGFSQMSHMSLKCLTARVIGQHRIPYSTADLPRELVEFVDLHKPQAPDGGDFQGFLWGLGVRNLARS